MYIRGNIMHTSEPVNIIVPHDFVYHEGDLWYVIARSIQDGVSYMLAKRDGYGFTTKIIIPTPENVTLDNGGTKFAEDKKFLSMQDYSLQAMYF